MENKAPIFLTSSFANPPIKTSTGIRENFDREGKANRKILHLPLQSASRFLVAEFAKNSDSEGKANRKILHLPLRSASRFLVAEFAKNSDSEGKANRKILHLPLRSASRFLVAEFAKNSDSEGKANRKILHLPLRSASRFLVAEFAKNSDSEGKANRKILHLPLHFAGADNRMPLRNVLNPKGFQAISPGLSEATSGENVQDKQNPEGSQRRNRTCCDPIRGRYWYIEVPGYRSAQPGANR